MPLDFYEKVKNIVIITYSGHFDTAAKNSTHWIKYKNDGLNE